MHIIRTLTENDFGRQVDTTKWPSFSTRPGARAILLDADSRIALMHVEKYNYYKLPGGGIDQGESIEAGLKRELAEEVGATSIEIITEVGQIDEYREELSQKSEHYAFIARLTDPLTEPARTYEEIEQGYKTVWAKNLDEAIELVMSGQPIKYGQDFEKLRELTFLEYVKNSKLLE